MTYVDEKYARESKFKPAGQYCSNLRRRIESIANVRDGRYFITDKAGNGIQTGAVILVHRAFGQGGM